VNTIGNLFDQLCILEKRKEVLEVDVVNNHEVIEDLLDQRGWIIADMARITKAIKNGKHPGTLKKNKIYDADVEEEECNNLIDLISSLDKVTRKLWQLEDSRRDKTLSDGCRLDLADQVSKYNKKRNNIIDRIDVVYTESLKRAMNENPNFRC